MVTVSWIFGPVVLPILVAIGGAFWGWRTGQWFNVAVLVYARTATRRGEIAVRSALGASRRRIVGQLFAEALVLSLGAAALGLGFAQLAIRILFRLNGGTGSGDVGTPFWVDYGLRPTTVLFTIALAALAAVIVGVVPAVKATPIMGSRSFGGARSMMRMNCQPGEAWPARTPRPERVGRSM